jgi:glycolate oxidase
MFMLGDAKLNEDVVLPQRAHGAFLRFLAGLSRKARLPVPTFGHLADGNFHVNILYHAADAGEAARAEAAAGALMRKVVALGGAISGEHGIGLAKTPFLRVQHGAAEVRAMLAVKRALDPRGILNPGKIFTPVRVQGLPRAAVKLPWERR